MKKYLIILLLSVWASSKAQNSEQQIDVDFFSLVKYPEYLWTMTYSIKNKNDITVVYYEFYMKDTEVGQGCIYAIAKQYPEQWTINAVESPRCECSDNKGNKPLFYINCEARALFTKYKERLVQDFDIYSFFVDRNDLEGPFLESSEFGDVEYYNEKSDSKIIIYKYEAGNWVEKEKQLIGDETPRTFGSKYMRNIAEKIVKQSE